MFLIYNVINVGIKYYGTIMGYEKGVEYINSGEQAKSCKRLSILQQW